MIDIIEGFGQHKILGIVTDSQRLQPLVQKWHKTASLAPVCFNDPSQAKIWAELGKKPEMAFPYLKVCFFTI